MIPFYPIEVPIANPTDLILELYDALVAPSITDTNTHIQLVKRFLYRKAIAEYANKQFASLSHKTLSSPEHIFLVYQSALLNVGLTF